MLNSIAKHHLTISYYLQFFNKTILSPN